MENEPPVGTQRRKARQKPEAAQDCTGLNDTPIEDRPRPPPETFRLKKTPPPDGYSKRQEEALPGALKLLRGYLKDALDFKQGRDTEGFGSVSVESVPIFFPIIEESGLRSFLSAVCGVTVSGGPMDIARVARARARLKLPRRLPRIGRHTVRPRLLFLRDTNVAMRPFFSDFDHLVSNARRLLGQDAVAAQDFGGGGRILPAGFRAGFSSVVVVSDLQDYAARHGDHFNLPSQWLELARCCHSHNSRLVILSPGTFWASRRGLRTAIARPALADLFQASGRRFPIVPWCEKLPPSLARAFSKGTLKPGFFAYEKSPVGQLEARGRLPGNAVWPGRSDPGTPDGASGDLAALLSLASDFDFPTLRTLRLCLSDPSRVLSAYDSGNATPRVPTRVAGPLSELFVWSAPLLKSRRGVTEFSPLHEHITARRPPADDETWAARYDVALQSLRFARARRGARQLIQDRLRWFQLQGEGDVERMADVEAAFLAHEAARTSDVNGASSVMPRGAAQEGDFIGVSFRGKKFALGVNRPGADVQILLRDGERRDNLRVELLNESGERVEPESHKMPGRIDRPEIECRWGQATVCALRIGSRSAYVRRPPSVPLARPLFRYEQAGRPRSFFFDGEYLVVGRTRYAIEGFVPQDGEIELARVDLSREAIDALAAKLRADKEDGSNWLDTGSRISGETCVVYNNRFMLAQLDPRSDELSGIFLTPGSNDSTSANSVGPGGAAVIGFQYSFVAAQRDDGTVALTRWNVGSRSHRFPLSARMSGNQLSSVRCAASSAGAIIHRVGTSVTESADGKSSDCADLVWLEPYSNDPGAQQPRLVQVPLGEGRGFRTRLAFSASGLIAVLNPGEVLIYEPPWQLLAGGAGTSALRAEFERPGSLPAIELISVRTTETQWHGVNTLSEHLLAETIGLADRFQGIRLCRLREHLGKTLDAEVLEQALNGPEGLAQAVSAIWNGLDSECLRLLERTPELLEWQHPVSGCSLLHLAAACEGSSELLEALSRKLGVDPPNALGFTPLLDAARVEDGRQTFERLLDLGADPRLAVEVEGERIGVLAAMFWSETRDTDETKPPKALVERVIASGAPVRAVFDVSGIGIVQSAACHGDLELFQYVLNEQPDVDKALATLDNSGWSALSTACYYGAIDIVRYLVGLVSPIGLRSRIVPIEVPVFMGYPEILDCLLEAVRKTSGGKLPAHPDIDTLRNRIGMQLQSEPDDTAFEIVRTALRHGLALDGSTSTYGLTAKTSFDKFKSSNIVRAVVASGEGAELRFIHSAVLAGAKALFEDTALLVDPELQTALDPLQTTPDGMTLAHLYAAWWSPDSEDDDPASSPFGLLADRGLDLSRVDEYGHTPLHVAAAFGHVAAVRAIVALAPNLVSTASSHGLYPLDYARTVEDFDSETLRLLATPLAEVPVHDGAPPDTAGLSLAPDGVDWELLSERPVEKLAGMPEPTLPLAEVTGLWMPVLRRRTGLPYEQVTWLVETWWKRSDGKLGVSAECQDAEGDTIMTVDGLSAQMHDMNAKRGLTIDDEEAAASYLYFFCSALIGGGSNFSPIWSAAKTTSLRMSVPDGLRLGTPDFQRVSPDDVAEDGDDEDDRPMYLVTCPVLYHSEVGEAQFHLFANGNVEMVDDNPIEGFEAPSVSSIDGKIFFRGRKKPAEGDS